MAQSVLVASTKNLSQRIDKLEEALEDYNYSIINKDVPLFTSKEACPYCGDGLYAIASDGEWPDVIEEFWLECSSPDCDYQFSIWRKE